MFRILSVIAPIAILLAGIAEAGDWQIEMLDQSGTGKSTSLRIDRDGNAHLAYVAEDGGFILKYAFWDHAAKHWFTMNVATGAGFCSLALDSKQRPHISYADYGTGSGAKLRYAHWDGSTWRKEVIPLNSEVIAYYTSIVLDADDRPSISFYEYRGPRGTDLLDRLRIVTWNGQFWQVRTVDQEGQSGKFNGLAIDGQGHLHIGYANVSAMTAGMRYAYWNGASWLTEVLDGQRQNDGGTVGYSACIVLDKQGNPNVAYMNVSHPSLRYAVRRNGRWQIETVDTVSGVGYPDRNSIAIYDNIPYISYYDAGRGVLKLAHKEGQSWLTEVVDSNSAGFTSSLQIDRGNIWVSYADEGASGVKVARRELTPREASGAPQILEQMKQNATGKMQR